MSTKRSGGCGCASVSVFIFARAVEAAVLGLEFGEKRVGRASSLISPQLPQNFVRAASLCCIWDK